MNQSSPLTRIPIAVLLGWLIPGLGHLFLKHKTRGLIFLVTITATFWTGVAVGGLRSTVDPQQRRLWFIAQMGSGGNALLAWAGNVVTKGTPKPDSPTAPIVAHWRATDVAIHYTGVAGLLNILVILDAIARAESSDRKSDSAKPTSGDDS